MMVWESSTIYSQTTPIFHSMYGTQRRWVRLSLILQQAREGVRELMARMAADEDLNAYLAALRLRYPVHINQQALETKER